MKYRIEDEFETTIDSYWSMFFSEDYNEGLYRSLRIGYTLEELKRSGEGDNEEIHRILGLSPDRDLPPIIVKFAGGKLNYREFHQFDRSKNEMTVETVPSALPSKIKSTGVYRLMPASEGKIRRVWEGRLDVGIPLVGKTIEKLIVSEVEQNYRETTVFTRSWLAKNSN